MLVSKRWRIDALPSAELDGEPSAVSEIEITDSDEGAMVVTKP
jgi:hypothetical protein